MFTLVMDSNGEPEKFKASPFYPAVTPTCWHRTWEQTQASYPFHTPCPCPGELRLEHCAKHSGLGSLLKPGRQSFTGKDGLSLALAGHAEVCLVTLVAMTSTQYLSDGKPVTSECHRRTFQGLLMAPPGQQIPSSNPELILVLRNLQHLESHGQPASGVFIGPSRHPASSPSGTRKPPHDTQSHLPPSSL